MSETTLEAVEVQETSQPVEEVKKDAVKGEEAEVQEADDSENEGDAEDAQAEEPEDSVETLKEKFGRERKSIEKMQKRISSKTAATKALEEQVQQLKQEVEKFKPVEVDDAPKQDDFDDYDAYEEALVEHKAAKLADKQIREAKERELHQAEQRQSNGRLKAFLEKENSFKTEVPDYDDVSTEVSETLADLQRNGVNTHEFGKLLLSFENTPALVYEIGKSEIVEELAQMNSIDAMRELVKLEMGLENKVKTKTEAKKLPEPIKPVVSKGGIKPLVKRSGKDVLEWVNS